MCVCIGFSLVDTGADVDVVGQAVALHAGGGVDGVSKQTVARHLLPHHARQHRAAVEPHADL